MATRKKRTVKEGGPTAAGGVIERIERMAEKMKVPSPHIHVSDPIPDEDTLKAGLSGSAHVYSRFSGHPDNTHLEQWLSAFEGGAKFRVFGSGMAAITAALFAAGEINGPIHVIAILPIYGGTYALLRKLARSPAHNFLVTTLYANDPQLRLRLYDAIGPSTRAVIFEVSGNPTLTFPDVEEIVYVAHKANPSIITICDNTFLFGLYRPLKWGVDVVVGSGTKYLVGESSWLMGYLGVSEKLLENCPQFWAEVVDWATELGGSLGPIESWITGRFSTKDVMERVLVQSDHAMAIAVFLESHPAIERVVYPGLSSYPWLESVRYLDLIDHCVGSGGMISFYLKNADIRRTERFLYYLNNHTHIKHKASLGGPVDSVESPLLLSHAGCDPIDNLRCDILKNLVRFSTGYAYSSEKTIEALDKALRMVVLT